MQSLLLCRLNKNVARNGNNYYKNSFDRVLTSDKRSVSGSDSTNSSSSKLQYNFSDTGKLSQYWKKNSTIQHYWMKYVNCMLQYLC